MSTFRVPTAEQLRLWNWERNYDRIFGLKGADMSRFDYVKYDDASAAVQAVLKLCAQAVEAALTAPVSAPQAVSDACERFRDQILQHLAVPHARSACDKALAKVKAVGELAAKGHVLHAIDALEVAYMWCGKAIRDDQVATRGAQLQESRGNE